MFIVGVTGGIATGKSELGKYLRKNNIPVLDADIMARRVVEPGKKAWHAIKREFSNDVFHPDGQINREALGDVIFNDKDKRTVLNKITHFEIYKELVQEAFSCLLAGHQFAVMELPLLYETRSMLWMIHKVIVVNCDEDKQLRRVVEARGMSVERAQQRISSQMPLDEKCSLADFVIENSGDLDALHAQADGIIKLLKRSKTHWKIRLGIMASTALVITGFVYLYSFFF